MKTSDIASEFGYEPQQAPHCPDYYAGTHEPFKVMHEWWGKDSVYYHCGDALAYLARMGKKPDNEMKSDIAKAIKHLQAALDVIEAKE